MKRSNERMVGWGGWSVADIRQKPQRKSSFDETCVLAPQFQNT